MSPPSTDRDAIAARAFAIYVRRGRQPGRALDDWLEAERQLRAEGTAPRQEPGVARGTLTGQPVPPKALPASQVPATLPAPARASALPAASAPAPLTSTPVPQAPAPPRRGRKGRKKG